MKHFINERGELVREAIDGVLMTSSLLARLDGFPSIKVVVRADWDRSKVAIISGGGAGHEPAHIGFVGRGMLTAAVSGEVFASPSVDAVLAAILAVTGDAGCLLIVKNYTGDRLNFGLAREKARALGKKVEIVIVADDIAIPGAIEPRGVAGTLFVHKVAGHFAENGATLSEVTKVAARVAKSIASIGISLSSCTIPGQAAEARMTDREAELGLGIHGEPGVEKIALAPARDLIDLMVARFSEILDDKNSRFALLVNGLGGVPNLELSVIMKCALESRLGDRVDLVVGPANLMTSLDMKGFSLSLLRLDPEIEGALTSSVSPTHWPPAARAQKPLILPLATEIEGRTFPPSANAAHRKIVETVCRSLIAIESELDALDAKVGDGDTGSTLAGAAREIQKDIDKLPLADLASLFLAISRCLAKVMGGSSGVLLSIFTAATGTAIAEGASLSRGLLVGISRMQEIGGAKLGDRTMIDALLPALERLDEGADLSVVAARAEDGAAKTEAMVTARAGRSSYVRAEALRGVRDPGAAAVAHVFAALAPLS